MLYPGFGLGFSPGSGPGSGLEVLARRFRPGGSGREVPAGPGSGPGSGLGFDSGFRWPLVDAAEHCLPPLGAAGSCWMLLGAAGHICANFATFSLEPLTMLNPQVVAGEHGLFGGHKSEDIRTFFYAAS